MIGGFERAHLRQSQRSALAGCSEGMQSPQPHRDRVRPPEALEPRRNPLRPLPKSFLLCPRSRCYCTLLAAISEF